MIVRILTEGQYDVPAAALPELNALDADLTAAAHAGDEARFGDLLDRLLAAVRVAGSPVPNAALVSSDLVLPAPDAGLAEVVELINDDGLIPG